MLRLVPLALISLSCAQGGRSHNAVHSSIPQDDAPQIDALHEMIDAAIDAPMIDAPLPCKPPNIVHGDGHHNPGMDCMSSCHNHGFSVAGTVLLADRVSPAVNATVTIADPFGNSQDLIVGNNGNFFSYLPVVGAMTVQASLCPSTQAMTGHPTKGTCNSTGCHEPGGVQGAAHL